MAERPRFRALGAFSLVAVSLALGLLLIRCGGAEGVPAPSLDEPPGLCGPLPELMPGLYGLLRDPSRPLGPLRDFVTEAVRRSPPGERVQDPLVAVLIDSIRSLKRFGGDPSESADGCLAWDPDLPPPRLPVCGTEAAPGEPCENRMCALRRALDFGVRGEVTADAFAQLEPSVSRLLGYITNRGEGADGKAHWEIVEVLHRMSSNEALCPPESLVDVIDGVAVYFRPRAECGDACPGTVALATLRELLEDPSLRDFLGAYQSGDEAGGGDKGRAAMQVLVRVVLAQLAAMPEDERYFDGIDEVLHRLLYVFFDSDPARWGALRQKVEASMELLRSLLDPSGERAGQAPMLRPLKAVARCLDASDPEQSVVGALYDLLTRPPERGGFDVGELVGDFDRVLRLDRNGALLGALHALLSTLRGDEQALSHMRELVAEMLRPKNAQRLLPPLRTMIDHGVVPEVLGLVDHLLYGCRDDERTQ